MNFNDILDTKVSDIEKPPLPPFGLYKMIVTKYNLRDFTDKNGKEWQSLDFIMRGLEAGENVDTDALDAYGPVKNIVLSRGFMFDKDDDTSFLTTLNNVRSFIEKHLGIEIGKASIKEILPKTINAVCMCDVQYQPDKNDASNMFARIKGTAAVS